MGSTSVETEIRERSDGAENGEEVVYGDEDVAGLGGRGIGGC